MGKMEFHRIETGLPGPAGSLCKELGDFPDFLQGQILDLLSVTAPGDFEKVNQLGCDLAVGCIMDSVHQALETGDKAVFTQPEQGTALLLFNRDRLGNDKPYAPSCIQDIPVNQFFGDLALVGCKTGHQGRHHNAVGEFELTSDIVRLK